MLSSVFDKVQVHSDTLYCFVSSSQVVLPVACFIGGVPHPGRISLHASDTHLPMGVSKHVKFLSSASK